ncbi:MAG: hypothetical protein JRD04_00195 [Deltaproteobacteria bacterium]|nr:hypothetical protein [Deltaproteobacteria bacterium]
MIQAWILQQLRDMEGVESAELKWETGHNPEPAMMMRMGDHSSGERRMMRFQKAKPLKVTSPYFDAKTGTETVTETVNLISHLKNESDKVVGTLEDKKEIQDKVEGCAGGGSAVWG